MPPFIYINDTNNNETKLQKNHYFRNILHFRNKSLSHP